MALAQRLQQKGWTSAEIEHAMLHLDLAEQKKHPFVKFTDKSVYWLFLFALVLGIVGLTEFVFPLVAILPGSLGWIILLPLGAVFGALFAHVLHGMDHLHDAHHTIVLFVTIAATILSSWVVLGEQRLFGLMFALTFVAFYGYHWWKR